MLITLKILNPSLIKMIMLARKIYMISFFANFVSKLYWTQRNAMNVMLYFARNVLFSITKTSVPLAWLRKRTFLMIKSINLLTINFRICISNVHTRDANLQEKHKKLWTILKNVTRFKRNVLKIVEGG